MLHKIKFRKELWICIIIVELLFLGIVGFLYGKRENIVLEYTEDDMVYDSGENGFYLDASFGGGHVGIPELVLPKGKYLLTIEYERSTMNGTAIDIGYVDGMYRYLISTGPVLVDDNYATCEFWVRYGDRPIRIGGRLTGDADENDYIMIRNARITSDSSAVRNFLFYLSLFFLLIDILLFGYSVKDKICLTQETKSSCIMLLIIVLCSSIPLMLDYIFGGQHDSLVHLMRIEGIKEALEAGMFPVRIQPVWFSGHGYAISIFYGDLLLYFPAVLRFFGVSVLASYQLYILFINIITALISYYCFRKMSTPKIGMVCTAVYVLNVYRLVCIYTRAAVGEYTAMAFIPLVLYGLWKTYTLPEELKEHERSWLPIAAGCTGIFLSHMITTEMTAFFIIITAVILWKKTFRKKTFLVLIKTVVITLCLNLWFLVPFIDYMVSGTYAINMDDSPALYTLEDKSVSLAQLFMTEYDVIKGATGAELGVGAEMPQTPGCALLMVLAGWFLLCFLRKERNQEEKKTEYLAVFLSVVSLMLTTSVMPYSWLANHIPLLKMTISSIQYPMRFLTVAGILLVYLLCLILQKEWITKSRRQLFAVTLLVLTFWQSLSYTSKCLNTLSSYRVYETGDMEKNNAGGAEYIPIAGTTFDRNLAQYKNGLTYDENAVTVFEWHREHLTVTVSLTNNTDMVQQVEVPLFLYKGYQALTDTGEKLLLQPGAACRISVGVPAGFQGQFQVTFKEPWYWRICEIISLGTLLFVLCFFIKTVRADEKNIIWRKTDATESQIQ